MKLIETALPEVLVLAPKVYGDERGFFMESYNRRLFAELGLPTDYVQDNHSRSARHVLRGIHYQVRQPQGKLVRVVRGAVYDVAVDLRRSSPNFGRWAGFELSEESKRLAWIPPGFGHGFLVLSESADFLYKATDFYAPEHERCVLWNDPAVGIEWPLAGEPVLSQKDRAGLPLARAEVYP
jgi:dTDP-4-dehydrorhamnose 3,5-epimerase